jgi:hypothetical protein
MVPVTITLFPSRSALAIRLKKMYNLKGDMLSGKKYGQVSALDVCGR